MSIRTLRSHGSGDTARGSMRRIHRRRHALLKGLSARKKPLPRTAWHPMFFLAVEASLDLRVWRVVGEFLLNKEPRRIDGVIVRREFVGPEVLPVRMRTVLSDLKAHNIVHLKGATDELESHDVNQLLSYSADYMTTANVDDPGGVSLRVVASALTPRFLTRIQRFGGALEPTDRPGVHEGRLGPFALRVIETNVACMLRFEEALYLFSARFLREQHALTPVDERERALYNRLYRCITQIARSPEAAMIKDADLLEKKWVEELADMLLETAPDAVFQRFITRRRLAGIPPEQLLAEVPPEKRLAGIPPEQRLAGLAPEQIAQALDHNLSEADQVLALPDHLLRLLPADYIATLPQDAQARVRARRQD